MLVSAGGYLVTLGGIQGPDNAIVVKKPKERKT